MLIPFFKKAEVRSPQSDTVKESIWETVGRLCVYLLFGLFPLWFLPFSTFPVDDAKNLLAGILIFAALGAWLAQALGRGSISTPKMPKQFWGALIAFFFAAGASSMASLSRTASMWGNTNQPDTFMNFILAFGALLIVPLFLRDLTHIIKTFLFFSASLVIVEAISLAQFFGIFAFPFDFARSVSFNTVGAVQTLGLFLAAGLVMLVVIINSFRFPRLLLALFILLSIILGFTLLLIDSPYIWLGLLVAFALLTSWQVTHIYRTQKSAPGKNSDKASFHASVTSRTTLPTMLIVVSAILFFVRPPIPQIVQLPATVGLNFPASIGIAREVLTSGPVHALLGTGPGTYSYDYLKYRPIEINDTPFFGVRFIQGYSFVTTIFATLGIVGSALLLIILGILVFAGFKGISDLSNSGSPFQKTAIAAFTGFIFLLFTWFFYPLNSFILLFTFLVGGLVLASLRAGGDIGEATFSFVRSFQQVFLFSFFIIVVLTAITIGGYSYVQKYAASAIFTSGVKTYNERQDLDAATSRVQLALTLDGGNDRYWRTLSDLFTLQANRVLNDASLDSGALSRKFQDAFRDSIAAARGARDANPSDPANWEQIGNSYGRFLALVDGAETLSIDGYMRAAELNPKNPVAFFIVGRTYIAAADALQGKIKRISDAKGSSDDIQKMTNARKDSLAKALDYLAKSLELKKDYAPANFLVAQVYERQGNRASAIQKTIEMRDLNPQDVGVRYQLGLLYYFNDQLNDARSEFEAAIGLNPNYSDARYFLGLTHDKQGKKIEAIVQFEKISELNPDNKEIGKILENLRQGRGALEGIAPSPENRADAPIPENDNLGE